MHLQVCEEEEKRRNTCVRSPHRARRGEAAMRWAWVHDVRVNSSPKSGLIRFDRDRLSRLRDVVTLSGSSL
jgi:hypothetical protein